MQYSRTLIFINTWSILHYFYDYITHGDGEFFITKYRLKCVVYYIWRRGRLCCGDGWLGGSG